jgi:hypothetical protein
MAIESSPAGAAGNGVPDGYGTVTPWIISQGPGIDV